MVGDAVVGEVLAEGQLNPYASRLLTRYCQTDWFGKIFNSVDDVEPIVCFDDGNLFSNNELSRGGASLWDVEFRGEVTATMVYDGQPVLDHLKRVDENTLMGIMDGKRQRVSGNYLYFLLERI